MLFLMFLEVSKALQVLQSTFSAFLLQTHKVILISQEKLNLNIVQMRLLYLDLPKTNQH